MSHLTYDDFIAFNYELTALVKAGAPLPASLRAYAQHQPAHMKSFLQTVSTRLDQGESIDRILQDFPQQVPPVYAALIKAGMRTNRLGELLEDLHLYLSEIKQQRSKLFAACIYPLFVIFLAYYIMVTVGLNYLRTLDQFFDEMLTHQKSIHQFVIWISELNSSYFMIFPGCYLLLLIWWLWTRNTPHNILQGRWGPLGLVPGVKSYQRTLQKARLCHMLGLLTEHHVPLPEAINIASQAIGDQQLKRECTQLSDKFSLTSTTHTAPTSPALSYIEWVIKQGTINGQISAQLRQVGRTYYDQAVTIMNNSLKILPFYSVMGIGTFVFLYFLTVFIFPYIEMINQLNDPRILP
jgi:type II secretory pathway component PulF